MLKMQKQMGKEVFPNLKQATTKQNTTPKEASIWKCECCGIEWPDNGVRKIRCRDVECVYLEHKDANLTKKPYPTDKKPLSWKNYGQAYPPKQQAYFDKQDKKKGEGKKPFSKKE